MLVTFSGIDGAGKSTQISKLRKSLVAAGLSAECFAWWDDVAVLRALREAMSRCILKGDPGVGTPDRPINRRDKNVSSCSLTLTRLLFSLMDTAHLAFMVAKIRRRKCEVVIFDRYIYDELANLPLPRPAVRVYVRTLLKFVPRPDLACLLDADPVEARRRKPEYPLAFLQRNRQSYLALAKLAGGIIVIDPLAPGVENRILQMTVEKLPRRAFDRVVATSGEPQSSVIGN
jgi:thymidylate kinase